MAEKTVLVCDVCGAEPAHTVALRIGRANWRKDLCDAHTTELLKGARQARRGRPAKRNPGRVTRATPKVKGREKATPRRKPRARPSRPGASQDVAAQAMKLRAAGLSYRQIGEALIKEGIKPPRAEAWNPVVIGRMLKRAAA